MFGVRREGNSWAGVYRNEEQKDVRKTFSISKYGDEEAFRLAVQYRLEGIKRMNEEFNFEYTERHIGNEFKDVLIPSNI